jgi:chromosome segregation ATPase
VSVTFGDQKYSLDVAKARLKASVTEYTELDKDLTRTRAKLDTQQRIIDKLEKQRLEMTQVKADLDGAIDELEAELQGLKLQQMESKYQTDDTRLAHIKKSIADQKKRFDVTRRELNLMQDTEVTPVAPTESVDEIMAPVNRPKAATPAAAPQLPKAD